MQSNECVAVLGRLNVHVALVGSYFDDKGTSMFTSNILFQCSVHLSSMKHLLYTYKSQFYQ